MGTSNSPENFVPKWKRETVTGDIEPKRGFYGEPQPLLEDLMSRGRFPEKVTRESEVEHGLE